MGLKLSGPIAVLLSLMLARAFADDAAVPYIDQIGYRSILLKSRPDLSADSCAMDIRVRSSFQNLILTAKRDFDWITKNQYPTTAQEADHLWIQGLQSAENKRKAEILSEISTQDEHMTSWSDPKLRDVLSRFEVYPGFYDPDSFISYQIGPTHIQDSGGFVYKVFFEFRDPSHDLTPDLYFAFSQKLKVVGFEGDSKIPVLNGWARFFYNDIIVHASSMEKVLIAEKVGKEFFGSKLGGFSRGVDVNNNYSDNVSLDWNNFLCRHDPEKLPESVLKFARGP